MIEGRAASKNLGEQSEERMIEVLPAASSTRKGRVVRCGEDEEVGGANQRCVECLKGWGTWGTSTAYRIRINQACAQSLREFDCNRLELDLQIEGCSFGLLSHPLSRQPLRCEKARSAIARGVLQDASPTQKRARSEMMEGPPQMNRSNFEGHVRGASVRLILRHHLTIKGLVPSALTCHCPLS